MNIYKRNLDVLRTKAVLHWPEVIIEEAKEGASLPILLKTQEAFISVIKTANKDPLSWNELVKNSSELTGNIFLKHLMVLSDLGGEALNKYPPLKDYIPDGVLRFKWNDEIFHYKLKAIGEKCPLTNSALNVDSKGLLRTKNLNDRGFDVCMLLLFGSQLIDDKLPANLKDKCVIGQYFGKADLFDRFIKQQYLCVSRQLGGATANSLGQITQAYVARKLSEILGNFWVVKINASLPGVVHSSDGNSTNFDIVVESPSKKYYGIEISFQVTTNSTIERKARESENLMKSAHAAGHRICYVIDGAGNINVRENAISMLCKHSDCTVALSEEEIRHLAEFMQRDE